MPIDSGDTDRTIRELQTSLPWTIRYSRDYRANPQTHKDFAHALVHVSKALGKLHALADDMDHDREIADDPTLRERHAKYIADLVVCALRAANVFPGGVVDLQTEVQNRIWEKNRIEPKPVHEYKVGERVEAIHTGALGTVIEVTPAGPRCLFDSDATPQTLHGTLHVRPATIEKNQSETPQ